jgi:hypothetical protein
MSPIKPSRFLVWPLATLGLAALGAGGLLATPVRPPPPLASIQQGAQAIDQQALSPLSRFEARDGTWLAYRLYPAEDGRTDRLAIIAHGSSGLSEEMNIVARTLAESSVAAVAIDAAMALRDRSEQK